MELPETLEIPVARTGTVFTIATATVRPDLWPKILVAGIARIIGDSTGAKDLSDEKADEKAKTRLDSLLRGEFGSGGGRPLTAFDEELRTLARDILLDNKYLKKGAAAEMAKDPYEACRFFVTRRIALSKGITDAQATTTLAEAIEKGTEKTWFKWTADAEKSAESRAKKLARLADVDLSA